MITSNRNPKLQEVRSLLTQKKSRADKHLFVAEGVRLIEEGFYANWMIKQLLFSHNLSPRAQHLINELLPDQTPVEEVNEVVFNSISSTETSQGVLAVFDQKILEVPDYLDFVLIADQIRDPGNLGALMRTAWAVGVQYLILSPGSVDPYSPKVVRAAMGAHFHIPFQQMSFESIKLFQAKQMPQLEFLAAVMKQGNSCWQTDLSKPVAIILGSEAEGITPELMNLASNSIHLPMPGRSESLNAAIAGSILLFEVVRQRIK